MKFLKRYRKTAACLMLVVICTCMGTASAASRWADMGIGKVSADELGLNSFTTDKGETLTVFDGNDELGFKVESTDTSYSIMLQTPAQTGWYTLNVNNHGVLSKNSKLPGGLSVWLINSDHQPVLADVTLNAGENLLAVRLEANQKYRLTFLAYNSSVGLVTFSLDMQADEGAERAEDAAEIPAGSVVQESLAVNRDQDWFHIPSAAVERELVFSVRNETEGNMLVEVCNVFSLPEESSVCAAGKTASLQMQADAEAEYYLCIRADNGTCGAYHIVWCDGIHHAFSDETGGVFSQCSLCGEKMAK